MSGNAFHAAAPATGYARSPSEDRRAAGTTTSVLEAERSLGTVTTQSTAENYPTNLKIR